MGMLAHTSPPLVEKKMLLTPSNSLAHNCLFRIGLSVLTVCGAFEMRRSDPGIERDCADRQSQFRGVHPGNSRPSDLPVLPHIHLAPGNNTLQLLIGAPRLLAQLECFPPVLPAKFVMASN